MKKEGISIKIINSAGEIRQEATGNGHCEIVWYGSYEPGDTVIVEAEKESFIRIQIDALLSPATVYLKSGPFRFTIPFGRAKEPYPPEAFTGISHMLSAMYAESSLSGLLSENPLDVRGESGVYPHCTASVETRGEDIFAARNAIDGMIIPSGHGIWPYTSWGNGGDPDAHIDLRFGRKVLIEEFCVCLRADFPHDTCWKSGVVSFDDGTERKLEFEKTGKSQSFIFEEPVVSEWVSLGQLKRDESDASPFAALTQIRVFGRELTE